MYPEEPPGPDDPNRFFFGLMVAIGITAVVGVTIFGIVELLTAVF